MYNRHKSYYTAGAHIIEANNNTKFSSIRKKISLGIIRSFAQSNKKKCQRIHTESLEALAQSTQLPTTITQTRASIHIPVIFIFSLSLVRARASSPALSFHALIAGARLIRGSLSDCLLNPTSVCIYICCNFSRRSLSHDLCVCVCVHTLYLYICMKEDYRENPCSLEI